MGHVQPGGAAGGPPAPASDPLWPLWRQLTREFGTLRLLASAFTSGAIWGVYGIDLASGLRRSPMARRAFETVAGASDHDLDRLIELGRVNAGRHEAMWRMAVMFYISVPATVLLALVQMAPGAVAAAFFEGSVVLWGLIALLLVWMLCYFAVQWRARQIVAVLEMVRLERPQAG